ncbi:MAG TPA: GNAT family N-acetyltransferase [Phototrophicaceae bacterium]|nr:GNAT family N-acetyltransferase [Phototrophicaceae bacterium]
MTALAPTVRPATPPELGAVTDLCLTAFADEAVTVWVLPDPTRRRGVLREMLGTTLPELVGAQSVLLAVDREDGPLAVSFWVPRPAAAPPPDAPSTDAAPQAERRAVVEAATAARRPSAAHLHLSAMATLPEHRGRGAGSAMLSAGVELARELDLPVYLEASTADNHRLYARHGFRDHGAPIHLPGGPTLRPMWRDAGAPLSGAPARSGRAARP